MNNLSSKKADEAKNRPIMNLGVELPEFDKAKYPYGGYGKMKDFGWRIFQTKEYEQPGEWSRIVCFEDLAPLSGDQMIFTDEAMSLLRKPKPNEGYIFDQHLGPDYFIFGYQDNEFRFGIIGEDQSEYDFYLADNLFAIDIHSDYLRWVNEGDDSWFMEFKKEYFQQQVREIVRNGKINPVDLLQLAIFREDVVEPLVDNMIEKIGGEMLDRWIGLSYDTFDKVAASILVYSKMARFGVEEWDDEFKKDYIKITTEVCSEQGLRYIGKNCFHAFSYLLRNTNKDQLLAVNPPQELSTLCARILDPEPGKVVYNPFAALGGIAIALPDNEVKGEEENLLLSFASLAYDFEYKSNTKSDVKHTDPLDTLRDTSRKFHYIASILPLGMKDKECAEVLRLALDRLDEDGRLVCVLPITFTTAQSYLSIRKRLLKDDYSVTIIALPPLYEPFSSVIPCLVDIRPGDKQLRLVNGTGFAHRSVTRRVKFLMDSLLESISVKTDVVVDLDPEDVPDYILNPAWNISLCNLPEIRTGWHYHALGDIVLDAHTYDSKVILLTQSAPINATIDVTTPVKGKVMLKANENVVLTDYLLHELHADYVQQQASALAQGTVSRRISRHDLMKIQIAVPPLEEQHKILNEALKGDIAKQAEMIRQQYEQYEKEIHIRKHAMVQGLSSLHSQWNALNNYRLRNGGNIMAGDTVGRLNPIPVEQLFEAISTYLDVSLVQAEHLADSQYDWGEPVAFNPVAFIREYAKKRQAGNFKSIVPDESDGQMRIRIPHRALRQVLDNIVKNAQTHGFNDPTRHDYMIHYDVYVEVDNVVIKVANNGAPLADGLQPDMVFSFGYSSALNHTYSIDGTTAVHSGIGGDEIRSILHKFDASASIEALNPAENDGYTVLYTLKFKNIL